MLDLRCIAVDDEPLALDLLSDYICRTKGLIMLGGYTDPADAADAISELSPDIVFLDIEMPGLSGIQLAQLLPGNRFVFTTAYEQYAVKSYEVEAADYLLKPLTYERFVQSVERLKRMIDTVPVSVADKDFIFIKSGYRTLRIDTRTILYLEGARDYVIVHLHDKKIMTLQSMRELEERLGPTGFIRIHKSFVISVTKIEIVEKWQVIIGGKTLPVSETYRENIKRIIKGA